MSWFAPMVALLVGAFMAILDTSIVNVATPAMMKVLNVDFSRIEWVATAYMLALGMVVPASGWLGDTIGPKRLYITSLFIFTLGSLLCSISWNLPSIIAARIVQAVGGGLIMPVTMTMVYRIVPRERIGTAMGVWGMALLLAPAIGPTLGGYLVEFYNWRLIFLINLPIGIGGMLLAARILPRFGTRNAGPFDAPGFFTSSIGLTALLLALSEGSTWGWTSLPLVLLLVVSIACLTLFIRIELTQESPLLDLRVFQSRPFVLGNSLLVLITISLFGGVFFIPLFLQTARSFGAFDVGVIMLPGALATGLMMLVSGRIYDAIGPRLPIMAGIALLTWSSYLLHGLTLETSARTISVWLAIRGLGMGLCMMPTTTAALSSIPMDLVSRGTAINNIVQRLSASFGIALLGALLENRIAFHWTRLTGMGLPEGQSNGALGLLNMAGDAGRLSMVNALDDAFMVMALLTLVGFLPGVLIGREGKQQAGPVGREQVGH